MFRIKTDSRQYFLYLIYGYNRKDNQRLYSILSYYRTDYQEAWVAIIFFVFNLSMIFENPRIHLPVYCTLYSVHAMYSCLVVGTSVDPFQMN